MSAGNPEGFPWGSNCPSQRQRLLFAVVMGIGGVAWWGRSYFPYPQYVGLLSDFQLVWFGATALLHGADPYVLVGPGKMFNLEFPLLYPATAFIVAMPFALLSDASATMAFIFVSTFLMAYGITADGWHRLPIFGSIAFLSSVLLGQWSMVMTAALYLPWVAIIASAKPQASLPIVASSTTRTTAWAAAVGSLVVLAVSLLFLPKWPIEWWKLIQASPHLSAPIMRFGGPAILLVLLRWRRPEAWLVLFLACMPQTSYPYNVLMLLTLARTYREACILSILSTAGSVPMLGTSTHDFEGLRIMGDLMVASAYLPATILILRRPNKGEPLWWVQLEKELMANGQ
jgi:hypothetical protein